MSLITWACLRCVQELTTILGPQNRTQGSCEQYLLQALTDTTSTLQSMWLPRGDVGRRFASQETPSNCYLSTAPD